MQPNVGSLPLISSRLPGRGRWLCFAGAALGTLGLLGWIIEAPALTTILPGQPPMMPNTSVALSLVGFAGALLYREPARRAHTIIARLVGLLILALGVATLMEYVLVVDLGIDELIFRTEGSSNPARMSPASALAFIFLGTALAIFDYRSTARARPPEWLILSAGLLALVAITGMLLGATRLYRLSGTSVIGVALPTAASILLTSLGLLLQRPNAGIMRVVTSPDPGGVLLRRLAIPTILGPVLLALLVTRLLTLWLRDLPLTLAILVIAMTVVGLALLMITGADLNRAGAALRASESKFSGVISMSPDAIISVDEDQRIRIYNAGARRIFGWEAEEVVGKPLDVLIPERFRAVHREHVRLFAADETGRRSMTDDRLAVFGLRKSGREFPAQASLSKLRVGDGWLFTVIMRDITAEKRREKEERFLAEFGAVLASTLDYEETLANVANLIVRELADICIVETVEEGGPLERRLKVVCRDPSKALVTDALERAALDHRHPYLGSVVLDTRRPLLMSEVPAGYFTAAAQSDEHRRMLRELGPRSLIALPLIAHGQLTGAMVLVSTTEGRRYETEDLRFAEKLARRAVLAVENARLYRAAQHATQARDDVLGIVAHDLRNPLGTILMQASLLRLRGPDPACQTRAPAEMIERAATRMNRIIRDLLDVTRMDAGRLAVEQARISAGQVISESVEAHTALAASGSIDLRIDVARDLPEVWADHDRLLQVFENLIGNALKFTPNGGRITVGAAPRGDDVLLWVSDTGAGIPAHEVPHVFERFWQAHDAAKHGAGMGLPIVKGIVEAHGGHVWVESTVGRCSTFFFTIPMAPRVADWRPEPASQSP